MRSSIILFFLALFIFGQHPLLACSCNPPISVEKAFEATPFLVHGKIMSKELASIDETVELNQPQQKQDAKNKKFLLVVEVQILQQYKGQSISDTVKIYTTRNGASCGYGRFELGEEFIIYAFQRSPIQEIFIKNKKLEARPKEGIYWTNHCTRTTSFNEEEIDALEKVCSKNETEE